MTSVDILTPPTFPITTTVPAAPINPTAPTFPVHPAVHTVVLTMTATHTV